jgi:hypothetical protein
MNQNHLRNDTIPIHYKNTRFNKNPPCTKLMIVLTYHVLGILACHHILQGHVMNAEYSKSFPQYHHCFAIRDKHPGPVDIAIILRTNATAHSSDTIKDVLWHWGVQSVITCFNPPNFSLCYYDLNPKPKQPLHGK